MAVAPADSKLVGFQDLVPVTQETSDEQYGGMVAVVLLLVAVMVFVVGVATGAGLLALLVH
jgi:hypothetical protein